MSAVVSAERATRTWVTGVTGLLIVATAIVMMAWAAPPPHARLHRPAATSTSIRAQLESRVGTAESPAARTPSGDRP